jgi:methylase of polypeptide subunit release factors
LLAQGSHPFLAGCLFLEIGYDQGPAVMNIVGKYFQNCELKQDLAGRDRYVVAF